MSSQSSERARNGHWLLETKEAKRPRVDTRAIVEQAHALVHEGGSAALAMRPLASALGTSTSALYRRFRSKEWLLIAVVDYVLADVVTTPPDAETLTARDRLEHLSCSLREVLSSHPHLHEILTSRVTITPNTIRIAEEAFSCLRGGGMDDDDLVDAYNAWSGYVIGFTIIETKPPGFAPDAELQTAMRKQLEGAHDQGASTLAELMPRLANRAFGLRWVPGRLGAAQTSFEWGLRALVDGLDVGSTATKSRPLRSRPEPG